MPRATPRALAAEPAAFALERSPFYWLTRVYGGYQRAMGAATRRAGIDTPAWRVLMILSEFEPASVSTLAECASVPHSTMVKAVQRMQADALVAVAPDPQDGRVTQVRMTQAGRAALEQVHSIAARVHAKAFEGRRAGDVERLIAELRALTDQFRTSG